MFDGCVGKESTNARRRRCSTHTNTHVDAGDETAKVSAAGD
jgi:hypothetical protein